MMMRSQHDEVFGVLVIYHPKNALEEMTYLVKKNSQRQEKCKLETFHTAEKRYNTLKSTMTNEPPIAPSFITLANSSITFSCTSREHKEE